MYLSELFEVQRKLDAEIEKKHPVLPGEDRWAKKILALKIEAAELANELPEAFKFWSNKKNDYEKALFELVDCLHFILSLANCLNKQDFIIEPIKYDDLTQQLNEFIGSVHSFTDFPEIYGELFNEFIGLSEMLGFTWEQVEAAYMSKNQINHERQANGY